MFEGLSINIARHVTIELMTDHDTFSSIGSLFHRNMIILQRYPERKVQFFPPSLEFKSPVTVRAELQHSKDSTKGRLYFPIVLESTACLVLLYEPK